MKLFGKVALVTGAGRGIGRVIALEFAKEGAKVAVNDLYEARNVVEEIKTLGSEAIAIKANITKVEEVRRMVDRTLEEFGAIDILVNNAGISGIMRVDTSLSDADIEAWNRVLNVNLTGTFLCSRVIAEMMLKQKRGKIINIASVYGLTSLSSFASVPHYAASKAGVIGLTRLLAKELAPYILVNAIAPGFIDTEMNRDVSQERRNRIIQETPLKRLGQPEDIAKVALFLASNDSDFITGETIVVSGGWVMR